MTLFFGGIGASDGGMEIDEREFIETLEVAEHSDVGEFTWVREGADAGEDTENV